MDLIPNFAPQYDMQMYHALAKRDYGRAREIRLMLSGLEGLARTIGGITLEGTNEHAGHGRQFFQTADISRLKSRDETNKRRLESTHTAVGFRSLQFRHCDTFTGGVLRINGSLAPFDGRDDAR